MIRRSIFKVPQEDFLAIDIYDNDGDILYREGHKILPSDIKNIAEVYNAIFTQGNDDKLCYISKGNLQKRNHITKDIERLYCTLYQTYRHTAGDILNELVLAPVFERPIWELEKDIPGLINKITCDIISLALDGGFDSRYVLPKRKFLYLFEHVMNSAALAFLIAFDLKWDTETLYHLVRGIVLMEIGMMSVNIELLKDPKCMDECGIRLLSQHPATGLIILQENDIELNDLEQDILLFHHYSGKHNLSTILADLCSRYDALTSNRPIRAGKDIQDNGLANIDALNIIGQGIIKNSNKSKIFDKIKTLIPTYSIGTSVILNDGQAGYIYDISEDNIISLKIKLDKQKKKTDTLVFDAEDLLLGCKILYM